MQRNGANSEEHSEMKKTMKRVPAVLPSVDGGAQPQKVGDSKIIGLAGKISLDYT